MGEELFSTFMVERMRAKAAKPDQFAQMVDRYQRETGNSVPDVDELRRDLLNPEFTVEVAKGCVPIAVEKRDALLTARC